MVYDITNGMWPTRLEITDRYVIFMTNGQIGMKKMFIL